MVPPQYKDDLLKGLRLGFSDAAKAAEILGWFDQDYDFDLKYEAAKKAISILTGELYPLMPSWESVMTTSYSVIDSGEDC